LNPNGRKFAVGERVIVTVSRLFINVYGVSDTGVNFKKGTSATIIGYRTNWRIDGCYTIQDNQGRIGSFYTSKQLARNTRELL
jgi:hypothetical protein